MCEWLHYCFSAARPNRNAFLFISTACPFSSIARSIALLEIGSAPCWNENPNIIILAAIVSPKAALARRVAAKVLKAPLTVTSWIVASSSSSGNAWSRSMNELARHHLVGINCADRILVELLPRFRRSRGNQDRSLATSQHLHRRHG